MPIHPSEPRSVPRVLVTGAARRVGRATALELARAGTGLVLTYRESREECLRTAADAVAAAAEAGHAIEVRSEHLDLAEPSEVGRLGAALAGGAIDAIVHNASEYRGTQFGAIAAEDLERAFRTEVVGPCLLTQSLRDALARSILPGGGAVVFYSDVHALGLPRAGYTPYLVAKGAVERLAQQLALELAPRVRVHCIAPGVVLWPPDFAEDAKTRIVERTPLGRAGTAEDAARLVRFLVLEAGFMTGATIRLDGGRSLR